MTDDLKKNSQKFCRIYEKKVDAFMLIETVDKFYGINYLNFDLEVYKIFEKNNVHKKVKVPEEGKEPEKGMPLSIELRSEIFNYLAAYHAASGRNEVIFSQLEKKQYIVASFYGNNIKKDQFSSLKKNEKNIFYKIRRHLTESSEVFLFKKRGRKSGEMSKVGSQIESAAIDCFFTYSNLGEYSSYHLWKRQDVLEFVSREAKLGSYEYKQRTLRDMIARWGISRPSIEETLRVVNSDGEYIKYSDVLSKVGVNERVLLIEQYALSIDRKLRKNTCTNLSLHDLTRQKISDKDRRVDVNVISIVFSEKNSTAYNVMLNRVECSFLESLLKRLRIYFKKNVKIVFTKSHKIYKLSDLKSLEKNSFVSEVFVACPDTESELKAGQPATRYRFRERTDKGDELFY